MPNSPLPPARRALPAVIALALSTAPFLSLHAADAPSVDAPTSNAALAVPRVDAAVEIDGRLDEPMWQQAARIELSYEVQPGDNLPAGVRTVAHIAYTDDAVLIGFRADDPDPAKIRAFLRDRDALYNDDFLGVMLDTFDDQRRAYEFFVNPLGVQADLIRDEATGHEDDSWDGLWTSAARITATGYEAEMRIPFATLRFRDTDGARRWSATFLRIRPREFRYQYFSNRFERGARCFQCAFGKLEGFQEVRQGRNLEITPTLTVIAGEARDVAGQPWVRSKTEIEPGLDVAWSPSPNLTLNATVNPDFSQVESDQAQLDLNTSFALFFPEKRPFFLEGADYFNTPIDVLYTRQIADPDFGARITGRNGAYAYGVIAARDAVTQLLIPGPFGSRIRSLDLENNALIGRVRRNFGDHTTVGAITTLREGDDYRNGVAGVDARWQRGIHTVRTQWLHSDSRYPGELALDDGAPRGDALFAHYNIGKRNWSVNLQHRRVDPGFRADLGFVSQVGYEQTVAGAGYTWFGKEGAKISRISVDGDWDIAHRSDGLLIERELEGYVRLSASKQTSANAGGVTRERFWNGRRFDETFFSAYFETTPLAGFKIGSWQRIGDMLDLTASRLGDGFIWEPYAQLDIGRGVNLSLQHSRQRLRRDGGTAFDARVIDARLSWQLDPRQRLRLSVQASDVERDPALYRFGAGECPRDAFASPAPCTIDVNARSRDVGAQLLYSYKVNPRTALYAGYSHGAFDIDREDDALRDSLLESGRSVFLKLSYAWQPGA
jgi:hypothetical protein